ncbi:MAG: ATPase, partial [Raoultibacter sp.]
MELKRKVYDRLLEWKRASNGSTALFVDGARRVGKSYVCKHFAENEYASHMIIDFGKLPAQVRDIFE